MSRNVTGVTPPKCQNVAQDNSDSTPSFQVFEFCDTIKEEFKTLQAQVQSLKREHDNLLKQNPEEMTMFRQQLIVLKEAVAKRQLDLQNMSDLCRQYHNILLHILPILPMEMHQQVLASLSMAEEFSKDITPIPMPPEMLMSLMQGRHVWNPMVQQSPFMMVPHQYPGQYANFHAFHAPQPSGSGHMTQPSGHAPHSRLAFDNEAGHPAWINGHHDRPGAASTPTPPTTATTEAMAAEATTLRKKKTTKRKARDNKNQKSEIAVKSARPMEVEQEVVTSTKRVKVEVDDSSRNSKNSDDTEDFEGRLIIDDDFVTSPRSGTDTDDYDVRNVAKNSEEDPGAKGSKRQNRREDSPEKSAPGMRLSLSCQLDTEQAVSALSTIVGADDVKVLTGEKGMVKIWDHKDSAKHKFKFDCLNGQHVRSIKVLEGGTSMAVIGETNVLQIWDIQEASKRRRQEYDLEMEMGFSMASSTWTDHDLIYIGCNDGSVLAFDLRSRSIVKRMKCHDDLTSCISISRCGSTIWSGGSDNRVVSWDTRANRASWSVDFGSEVDCLGCIRGEEWIALGTRDGSIHCVNDNTRERRHVARQQGSIYSLDVAKTSDWFCTTNRTGLVEAWQDHRGKSLVQIDLQTRVICSHVSNDDAHLITGSKESALVYRVEWP